MWKLLSQGMHICILKALAFLVWKLWPRIKFWKVGQTSRSRSLGQKLWHDVKGLVTMNAHMQYESPSSSALKVMAKVEVFEVRWGSVPVDFLRPKFRVAHTKDDVISILMHKYTYTNMYIIKKIISCRFILCWDITSFFKPYEKSCRRRKVKVEKILTVTYHTLLTKTTNFLKSGGYKICLYLKIISYSI